jgi:hypothetical protein
VAATTITEQQPEFDKEFFSCFWLVHRLSARIIFYGWKQLRRRHKVQRPERVFWLLQCFASKATWTGLRTLIIPFFSLFVYNGPCRYST